MSDEAPAGETTGLNPDNVIVTDKTFQARTGYDNTTLRNLIDDMDTFGQRAPIGVRPHPERTGKYQPIYGFHRTKAARELGWDTIEATVYPDIDDATALELSIRDNSMHQDLDKVEKAHQAAELKADGWTVDDLCEAYNTNKSAIYNWLKVVELRDEILAFIKHGVLTLSHGVELSKVDDDSRRLDLTEMAVVHDISVRELNAQRNASETPIPDLPVIHRPTGGDCVGVCPLDLDVKSIKSDCAECPYAENVEVSEVETAGGSTTVERGQRVECHGFAASDYPDEVIKAVQTLWLESSFLRKEPAGVKENDDGVLWGDAGGDI
jgi:ParB/RepB/Spo0J family partition protein